MKHGLMLVTVLTVLPGTVYAGQGFDACRKQEQELRAKAAEQCSGLQYMFNPSGCFATRKLLKEYDEGKCEKIGRKENVQLSPLANTALAPAQNNQVRPQGDGSVRQNVSERQPHTEQATAPSQASQKSEACRQQEQELKSKESDYCTGIKYLLNPSGCFATRKQLKELNEGKCRATDAVPANAVTHQDRTRNAAPAPGMPSGNAAQVRDEATRLREENARLKAENERLKTELEQLRKSMKP